MPWYLVALSLLLGIDVQKDPLPAILLFARRVRRSCGSSWRSPAAATSAAQARGDLSGWRPGNRPRLSACRRA